GGRLSRDTSNLAYDPPPLALVVKPPPLIHTRASNLVISPAGGAGMAAADREGGLLVNGRRPVRVAAAGGEKKEPKKGPAKARKPLDPRTVWQEALVKGVTEPGLIIACADFLAQDLNRFDHAA